jgi:hypothetical protein
MSWLAPARHRFANSWSPMLADFQQALADLTASPGGCMAVLEDPAFLNDRYQLTEREFNRLVAIVRDPGMACACTVYRANRLAPLAMNIPDTCHALGAQLREIMDDYWRQYPEGNVHFFVETDRFCRFLSASIAAGRPVPPAVPEALAREGATIGTVLAASEMETYAGHPLSVDS